MSERLIESEYFTIDLRSLFKKDDEDTSTEDTPAETTTTETDKKEPTNEVHDTGATDEAENTEETGKTQKPEKKVKIDWAKELDRRISENEALDPETREDEGVIEKKFWEDYFADETIWEPEVAEMLKDIKLLQRDIKALGFDRKRNALLAFCKNKWVQKNIIKAGLLDSTRYTVLHNAVSKPRMIADTELMTPSRYNIIYCRDLYRKHPKDMETYLRYQQKSLPPNATVYTEETQDKNIRIFLALGNKDMKSAKAKLNKLKEVELLLGKNGYSSDIEDEAITGSRSSNGAPSGSSTSKTDKLGRSEFLSLIGKLKTVPQCQAFLQYLSMNTNNKEVAKALMDSFKDNPPSGDLGEASLIMAKFLSGQSFSAAEAKDYATLVLARISELGGRG